MILQAFSDPSIVPHPVPTAGDPLWTAIELAVAVGVVLLLVDGGRWMVSKWATGSSQRCWKRWGRRAKKDIIALNRRRDAQN